MVEPDVARAKIASINHHLERIEEIRRRPPGLLPIDIEDLTILNLFTAVQASLDLAGHVVSSESYGLPGTLAETFTLLEKNGVLDAALADDLRRMAGFRNVVVHRYAEVDSAIVERIVENHLNDLRRFAARIAEVFGLED